MNGSDMLDDEPEQRRIGLGKVDQYARVDDEQGHCHWSFRPRSGKVQHLLDTDPEDLGSPAQRDPFFFDRLSN